MNILASWWQNHRTKTLGFLTTVFGAVLVYLPQMQASIPAKAYGCIFAGVGIAVAALGFVNSQKS